MKKFKQRSLLGLIGLSISLLLSFTSDAQNTQIKEQKVEITIEKKDAKGNSTIKKIIKNDGNYTTAEIDKMLADLSKENPGATVKVSVEETERIIDEPKNTTRKIIIDKRAKGEDDQEIEISINGEKITLDDSTKVMLFENDESGSWIDKSPLDIFKSLEGDSLIVELRKLESRLNDGYSRMLNPKAFMGIEAGENDKDGLKIGEIVKNSPAETAGLMKGDIILSLDGVAIKEFNDVRKLIGERKPGDVIDVNIKRGSLVDNKKVTLGSQKSNNVDSDDRSFQFNNRNPRELNDDIRIERVEPNNSDRRRLNIKPFNFRNMDNDKVQLGVQIEKVSKGVLVTNVIDGSAAYHVGLRNGDIITKLDKKIIRNEDDLINEVNRHAPGDEVKITFIRDGKRKTATARLGSAAGGLRFG